LYVIPRNKHPNRPSEVAEINRQMGHKVISAIEDRPSLVSRRFTVHLIWNLNIFELLIGSKSNKNELKLFLC